MAWFRFGRSEGLSDVLVNLFRLRIYKSEALLTPRVRAEQFVFAATLSLMLFVDVWAWYRAWSYGLVGQWFVPLIIGVAFGLAAIMFDRSVIVTDTTNGKVNGWYQIGGRALLLVLISFLTAVPVELAVFESEITKKLESQEKVASDQIRNKAIETETANLSADVSELQAHLAADASLTQANADTDIVRLQQDRARERTQMLAAQSVKRESLEKTLTEKSEQVALEAAGKGPSGKYGDGPAYKAMKQQEKEAREALDKFESEAATQVANFDTETQSQLVKLRATRDKTVLTNQAAIAKELDAKRKERKKKIEELRTMSEDKLAALYGGEWRVAKGFLARFHTLSEMADGDGYVNRIVWGCRIAMILLGMFVLGLKLMASQEFKLYYSLAAQAKAGDEFAQQAVANMGFTDFDNHGLSAKARDLLAELHEARQKVWQALWALEQKLATLSKLNELSGLCRTRLAIEGELHGAWLEKGADAMAEVNSLEEQIKLLGETVPAWPTKLGEDPRGKEPWKVSESKLATFGWLAPDQVLEAGRKGRKDLIDWRRQLRKELEGMRFGLYAFIAANPTMIKREIESHQRRLFQDKLVPILEGMETAEFAVQDGHLDLPPWPTDFSDPRQGLFEKLCRMEERELRDTYGWEGGDTIHFEPPRHISTTPVQPPAFVTPPKP